MQQKTYYNISSIIFLSILLVIIFVLLQLRQTNEINAQANMAIKNVVAQFEQQIKQQGQLELKREALSFVSSWHAEIRLNSLSCIEFLNSLDKNQARFIFNKKSLSFPFNKNIAQLQNCLNENTEKFYYDLTKSLTSDGSTYVADEITRRIKLLSDVANAWKYKVADRDILEEEFHHLLTSLTIRKTLTIVRALPHQCSAGKSLVEYMQQKEIPFDEEGERVHCL